MILLLLFIFIFASIVVYSLISGITPMPTTRRVRKVMLEAVNSEVDGSIFELGSGWGHTALSFARKFSKKSVNAYEISPFVCLFSKILSSIQSNLNVYWKDFFNTSLSDASIVVCYLYPEAMKKLADKFESELKDGALVVTNTFAIPNWIPIKIYEVDDLYRTKVNLYRISNNTRAKAL